ncbi:MAG: inositol monophosphatase [Saprospiraceae bacterium]|nr:inositol monophosphatase [Saprospiraceae bacterium]
MGSYPLEKFVAVAEGAAREAGQFIRAELGRVRAEQVLEKEKNSLVSYVDIETERMLADALRPLLPGAGFLTEESTQALHSDSDYCWIIDPLDGTTNFLKGIPVFSVSIALAFRMEPIMGVVYDVMQEEAFTAWQDGGAHLNGRRISVSDVGQLDDAIVATGFPYKAGYRPQLSEIFTEVLHHSRGIRRLGSAALDLAYTAAGRFDAYYETRLNAWDIAAGILIVREAGGRASNFRNASGGILRAHHVMASNGLVHDELLQLVSKAPLDD